MRRTRSDTRRWNITRLSSVMSSLNSTLNVLKRALKPVELPARRIQSEQQGDHASGHDACGAGKAEIDGDSNRSLTRRDDQLARRQASHGETHVDGQHDERQRHRREAEHPARRENPEKRALKASLVAECLSRTQRYALRARPRDVTDFYPPVLKLAIASASRSKASKPRRGSVPQQSIGPARPA
jgi:hypothetical protein